MQKIVINTCYGGFSLSDKAIVRYFELRGRLLEYQGRYNDRDCAALVQVVEELGSDSWGREAELKIVEVPDDVKWEIEENDGKEWVAEVHRTWC